MRRLTRENVTSPDEPNNGTLQDELLIEEVRKNPLIYDIGHSDYKCLEKKEQAWQEIATKVGISEDRCKKRWKLLRDTYKRCKKFEVVTEMIDAKPLRRNWRYYEDMKFLDNVKSSRNCSGWEVNINDQMLVDGPSTSQTVCSTSQSPFLQEELEIPLSSHEGRETTSGDVHVDENREMKILKFLELASASIQETCTAFVDRRSYQDSTDLHFASLAAKIREANFPMSISNQIEAKVAQLVYSEIEKYQDLMCEQRDS